MYGDGEWIVVLQAADLTGMREETTAVNTNIGILTDYPSLPCTVVPGHKLAIGGWAKMESGCVLMIVEAVKLAIMLYIIVVSVVPCGNDGYGIDDRRSDAVCGSVQGKHGRWRRSGCLDYGWLHECATRRCLMLDA